MINVSPDIAVVVAFNRVLSPTFAHMRHVLGSGTTKHIRGRIEEGRKGRCVRNEVACQGHACWRLPYPPLSFMLDELNISFGYAYANS